MNEDEIKEMKEESDRILQKSEWIDDELKKLKAELKDAIIKRPPHTFEDQYAFHSQNIEGLGYQIAIFDNVRRLRTTYKFMGELDLENIKERMFFDVEIQYAALVKYLDIKVKNGEWET